MLKQVYTVIPSEQDQASHGDTEADLSNLSGLTESNLDSAGNDAESSSKEVTITDRSYEDETISIAITECRVYDSAVYVADIQLSSVEYLKTAFAEDSYGKNVTEKTSSIAERNGAILAINGDYYGAQETGYVLRDGVLYRSSASKNQEDLVINADGSFSIITEGEISAEELLADGAQQILSFGPALIVDGTIAVSEGEEVGKAKAATPGLPSASSIPFTMSLSFPTGEQRKAKGFLYELADFMQSLGVTTGYNLDGGGSSTMVFNGEVINNPTSSGRSIKERSVSDIVYIGY
ncbi:MAG: phosphodiester glycosidase family protein [Clostridia bacterium]